MGPETENGLPQWLERERVKRGEGLLSMYHSKSFCQVASSARPKGVR